MTTLYQEIRAASKAVGSKVLDAALHLGFKPLRVAKRMTLRVVGRTIIFDDETAQNAFFDFMLHEYRLDGKSLVESVDPVAMGLEPLETEVLEAHRHTRTSFFVTEGVVLDENQVRLRDLLEPDRFEVRLTDIGFSRSMHQIGIAVALFCRLVVVRDLTMTSGFSFAFQLQRVPGILAAFRHKMKKVPPADLAEARFVFFFQKYRQLGVDQEFRDVS